MARLPEDRREVYPSKGTGGQRRAPSFGPKLNVSVPISIGLPLIAVGIALIVAGISTGNAVFWIIGGLVLAGGLALFASGKRL